MDDPSKPLRSKVLAVPKYRDQYLANVRTIAEKSLDWNAIGPFIAAQTELIQDAVQAETRKLGSYEAFVAATNPTPTSEQPQPDTGRRGGHGSMNLREFMDGRRAFLLK